MTDLTPARAATATTSFSERVAASRGHLIHKVTGRDNTGRRACYFVLVPPHKTPLFDRAISAGNLNLTDYGKIIASCYGETPTEKIRKLLKEKYGIDA